MTKQEIFEKVVTHLRKQGKKAMRKLNAHSISTGSYCVYRTDDGLSCAVGCLIPDDKYRPSMECGIIIYNDEVKKVLAEEGVDVQSEGMVMFLRGLQLVHDTKEPELWEGELKRFAVTNEVQLPAVA